MQNKHTGRIISFVLVIFVCVLFIGWQWFNRIPIRNVPLGAAVVSPANGKIIAIEKEDGETIHFFKNEIEQSVYAGMRQAPYSVVVIEMNIHNVHVQRAPISGTIVGIEYMPGAFKNAIFSDDKIHLANTNEKMLTVFENEKGTRVAVVQVAGVLARRIESWSTKGANVAKGEPYGIIKLGSQVVVILPDDIDPLVTVGQTVIDGETIIGVLPE